MQLLEQTLDKVSRAFPELLSGISTQARTAMSSAESFLQHGGVMSANECSMHRLEARTRAGRLVAVLEQERCPGQLGAIDETDGWSLDGSKRVAQH